MSIRELFDSVGPPLLRYLRRMTGSLAEAEEIVQDTFLKLHCRIEQGDPDLTNPRAWLFRVATNRARDLERERRIRAREDAQWSQLKIVDFESHVEHRQLTRRVLGRLPRRMRQVLLLWSEGFSYREIADITGIEPGYVGVLLQRARAGFRKEYDEVRGADPGRKNNGLL
ncbi:MAG: RNA polymerase sigma factor [Thermoanaerobaculia bacterium]